MIIAFWQALERRMEKKALQLGTLGSSSSFQQEKQLGANRMQPQIEIQHIHKITTGKYPSLSGISNQPANPIEQDMMNGIKRSPTTF